MNRKNEITSIAEDAPLVQTKDGWRKVPTGDLRITLSGGRLLIFSGRDRDRIFLRGLAVGMLMPERHVERAKEVRGINRPPDVRQ
jgi:hypothetical protein